MKSQYHRITRSIILFVTERHIFIAGVMLAMMAVIGLVGASSNTAIVDEVAHIPAAYSYLHYGDYRLNPEHPPLIKDLAGIPLQFMDLKFPENHPAWTTEVNGQWETGWSFLYHIGNDPDVIVFWARLPILALAVVFGAWLYWFCRKRWGTSVGLLTLFFYVLSPNILAHSTLVTTDLGASAFMFLAIVTFARFADKPTRGNFLLLSLALAAAQLAKFSAILLYPFLGAMAIGLIFVSPKSKQVLSRLRTYLGGLVGASALSVLWIWIYYAPHTWLMSPQTQDNLIAGSLMADRVAGVGQNLLWLNDLPLMKPLVEYILGLAMVFGRVTGGNVTYFNGEVTAQSFQWYFPQLFLMKTQVAFLILLVMALAVLIATLYKGWSRKPLKSLKDHYRTHVLEWTLGLFAVFYFVVSVEGNLNLGIRHILPIYVPLFVLVALVMVRRLRTVVKAHTKKLAVGVFALLMLWYGGSTLAAHPYYLPYFNELAGGSANADKYFSDSNVDWGQDLRRLKDYVEDHPEINHIAVDYFGGGIPAYYFCQRKFDEQGRLIGDYTGYDCSNSIYEEWHSQYGKYTGEYIAVSETFLMNDIYYAAVDGTPGYQYLRDLKPVAKIGYSIYLYKLR